MRLLSFIVGALACFAPTAIAGRVGYEIGTAAGLADVMANGIARPGWNGEVGANYFYPRTQSLKFVSRLNFTGIRPQPTIQTQGYSIRFEYSIPNVVQVSMDPLQQAGTLNVGSEQPIDMKFACLSSSGIKATMVTVITSFHDPPGDDSQFDFYKVCELPPINVGAYGPDGVRATVVQNGKPVDGFKFTVTPDEAASQFEMWLPIPLSQYYPYFNFSSPPQITWNHFAMPYLSWEISEPYILPQDVQPYTKLTINYNCDITMAASSTEISVIIDNGFASKLEFAFMKNCSYGAGQVLPNVFHVGSSDTGNDVIQGGTPIGNWGTNSGHVMPPNEHEIDLYAYINASTRVDGTSLPFSVVATVSNDNKVFILNEGSSAPRQFYANMSTVFPRTKIPMDITCISSGVASGTVVFSFGNIYRDVTVRFQYTCSKPYFDVNFMNSDASTVIAPVIVKNVQTWSYTSPQSSHKEVFQVKLSPNSPYAYDVQDITFDYVGYDASVMKPQVLPTNAWMPATVNTPIYMQILFHCIQDMPVSTTPVIISIDYGWNEKTNITFQKTCPETDAPSSSSGWSAAGIFFFTVFILTLVGCLTGAGYKYTKEDKRGWEIIPGITYYRACYDKACPTKRYTPQTDYYHDNIPDHGGKSYQTEL